MKIIFSLLLIIYIFFQIFSSNRDKNYNKFFLTVIFLLPLFPSNSGFEISKGLPLITFQKVLVFSLFLCWILRNKETKLILIMLKSSIIKYVILFFIFFSLNIIFNFSVTSLTVYFNFLFNWLLLCVISATTLLYYQKNYPKLELPKKFINILVLSATVVAFVGIVYSLTGINIFYKILPYPDFVLVGQTTVAKTVRIGYALRSISSFDYPIPLGQFLILIFSLALLNLQKKKLNIISQIIILLCIILTQTRGVYIGLLVFFFLLIILVRIKVKLSVLIVIFFIIYYSLYILNIDVLIYSIINPDASFMGENVISRFDALSTSVNNIINIPFWGFGIEEVTRNIGTGNFQDFMYMKLKYVFGDFPIYILIIYGLGYICAFFFLLILIKTVLILINLKKTTFTIL